MNTSTCPPPTVRISRAAVLGAVTVAAGDRQPGAQRGQAQGGRLADAAAGRR